MQVIDLLKALPWFFICLSIILRLKSLKLDGVKSTLIVIAFSCKMIGTLALQWIYTFFYAERSTADIYRFYDDGRILYNVFSSHALHYFKILFNWHNDSDGFRTLYFERMNSWIKPFESGFYNDNLIMIKLNSLLTLVTQAGYEANSILFSSMSFVGLLLLIKTILTKPVWQHWAIILTTALPSYLIFLSGGLKESVLLFGSGIFILSLNRLATYSKRIVSIILFGAGCWLLITIKPYFLASIVPAILAYMVVIRFKASAILSWPVWGCIVVLGIYTIHLLGLDLVEYVVRKQHDFLNHAAEIEAGSSIHISRLEYSWRSVLLSSPKALWRTIMEPMPWAVDSPSLILMLIENIFFSILLIMGVIQSIKARKIWYRSNFILLSVIPGLCLIGLISPILGATMRYRAPFIILILLALIPIIFIEKKTSQNEV